MDPVTSLVPVASGFLSEAWWNMVFIQYKTTVVIIGVVIGAVVKATKWKWDDTFWDAIKEKLPFTKGSEQPPKS